MVPNEAAAQAAIPLVTVALCVHNGAAFLREQMDSILAQSESRLEVVALDDASTDDSLAILQEYAARDARVRVESNALNQGPSRSFERAMSLGRAPFVAPSDQDDVWHPHKLERLLAAIGDHDLAYCDSAYVDADGRAAGRCVSDDVTMLEGRASLRFALTNSVSGHAMLVRRDLFEAVQPFPADVFHDWWLAASAAGRRGVLYVDEPLVHFRRHGGALTSLGRERGRFAKARTQAWFTQCRRMLRVLSARSGPHRQAAARLLAALDLALVGGSRWPLLAEIWRLRRELAADDRVVDHAVRLQLRMLRRLRRVTQDERDILMQQIFLR